MAEAKKWWFSKIESRTDALKIVKDTSGVFFFIAALQAVLLFLVDFSVLFDAVLYAVGGALIRRFYSRAAALALLVLAVLSTFITVANKLGENLGDGNNIFLALIVLWAGVRAVDATFKLHGKYSAEAPPLEPPHA